MDWAQVTQLRAAGNTWDNIAAFLTSDLTGDQLRKRYNRAAHGVWSKPSQQPELPLAKPLLPTAYALGGRVKALILPDTQVEAGVKLDHFKAAGRYAASKEVDVVVHLGDWGNFTSISSYNTRLSSEGLRLCHDIESCTEALELFQAGLDGYTPTAQILTLGNHEERLDRYIGDHPELEGSLKLPPFEKYGWKVYPFLQPVCVNGVYFAHYFTRTEKGWAGKFPHKNAQLMTRREMVSCVAGHTPGLDAYIHPAGGPAGLIRGTIAGSFYQHDESYQGAQGNRYWRGCLLFHELEAGYYNVVEVSMDWLMENYS